MIWRIEVAIVPLFNDPAGHAALEDLADAGVEGLKDCRLVRVYTVEGPLEQEEAQRVGRELLSDSVTERFSLNEPVDTGLPGGSFVVEVAKKAGVMDPVEASTLKGIDDMGIGADAVTTSRKYVFTGSVDEVQFRRHAARVLANEVIEECSFRERDIAGRAPAPPYTFQKITVDLAEADDKTLSAISQDRGLSLNLTEMKTIQAYYRDLGRSPTDVELETLAQTWSEHCVHKTFRGLVEYDGRTIDNLLKSTIARVTSELDRPWCLSVFEDNSGVIAFDDDMAVCFKVETHNHPSAIEPYGGAETGIGGVIRDPLGTGLGAMPVANTDVFCFAPPDMADEDVPEGALHPKRVLKGVVAGVRDYGNRMGIPTVNGAIVFDERFVGNPLVYCGNVGLIPRDKVSKAARPGDIIVAVGGRTGRDGIHGATLSSAELATGSDEVWSGAVQIGNPITEKKMTDVLLIARDRSLYTAITDCGAGGFSSAVGEMGQHTGAAVHLERAPLKYEGLAPGEIWCSEAQERMVLAVPPENLDELIGLFASEDVEATAIGTFTADKRLTLYYDGNEVASLDMDFLHNGVPQLKRRAVWEAPVLREPRLDGAEDYTEDLVAILSDPTVASKEWVIRQYDHEVQGGSVIKPLVGALNDGPSDAAVIQPVRPSEKALVISCGINPRYSDIDPYHMAANAIDEALRQVLAVGGSLEQTAILDNFCWGNTDKPDRLGALVRAAQACYDVAVVYGTPFISGKDSLNNEFQTDGRTIVIPGTLLISAISVMQDARLALTMDLKQEGNLLYLLGSTRDELGASMFYRIHGELGANVPVVIPAEGKKLFDALSTATADRLVRSCHDLSDGGLAVALAEMAFAGGLGLDVDISEVGAAEGLADHVVLFSESPSRFVVEVEPGLAGTFEKAMAGVPCARIGRVTIGTDFIVRKAARQVISTDWPRLKKAWQAPLSF